MLFRSTDEVSNKREPEPSVSAAEAVPELALSAGGIDLPETAIQRLPLMPGSPDRVAQSAAVGPATTTALAEEHTGAGPIIADSSPPQVSLDLPKSGTSDAPVENEPARTTSNPYPAQTKTAVAESAAGYVQNFPVVVVNGVELGAITVRQAVDSPIEIHLGGLLSLFRSRMHESDFNRLSKASSADQFVTLDELRRAGFDVNYDPSRERLLIGAK